MYYILPPLRADIGREEMKKFIVAASAFAAISFIASSSLAGPLTPGTVTLSFDAKQSVDVSCTLDTTFEVLAGNAGAKIHANGVNASGAYPCGLLSFKSDIDVAFDSSGSAVLPAVASISGIYLDTVYGECKQIGSLSSTLLAEWVVVGSGYIDGVVYPSTPAPCWFSGTIVFN
jgi:hypothetical protein